MSVVRANVPKYIAYTIFKNIGFGLFVSVWSVYLLQVRGWSLAQIALVDATFFIASTFGEIPTGIVADRFSRKFSLIIGTAIMAMSVLGWLYAPSMALVIAAYLLMGLGFTFLSGAEDAFFYESLQRAGRSADYSRFSGRLMALSSGGMMLGNVLGGILANVRLDLPFLTSAALSILSFACVLSFYEPRNASAQHSHTHTLSFGGIVRQALALMRANPALRSFMLYMPTLSMGSYVVEYVFLQPQARALGVPLAFIGFLQASVQATSVAASVLSSRLVGRVGQARIIMLVPIVVIGCLFLMSAFQVIPILSCVAVIAFASATLRPVIMARVQDQVPNHVRATILSASSMLFSVCAGLTQPLVGLVADNFGFSTAYIVLSGLITLVLGGIFVRGRRYLLA
jgi:MFS family permease